MTMLHELSLQRPFESVWSLVGTPQSKSLVSGPFTHARKCVDHQYRGLNTVSHSRDIWLIPILSSASYCCSSHRLSEVLPETQSRIHQNTATVSLCSSVDQRPVMSPSFHNLSPHYCYCTRNTWPSMQHDLWPVFLLSDDTPPVKVLMKPVGLSLSLSTFAEVIGGQRESTLAVFVVMQ